MKILQKECPTCSLSDILTPIALRFLSDGCSHSISFQNKKIVKTVPAFKPVSSREASGESDLSDTEDHPKHSSGKHNVSKFYQILFNRNLHPANEFAK